MRLLALSLLWFLLATSLLLSCDADKTENRDIRGYQHSGRFWPKTILWQGIRSSPGVLWFAFFFLAWGIVYSWFLLLLDLGIRYLSKLTESDEEDKDEMHEMVGMFRWAMEANIQAGLAARLLYVGLSVTQLSDLMEAYLVGVCCTQLLIDADRPRKHNSIIGTYTGLLSFLASVCGFAMMDSFRALNVLNVCYFTVGPLLLYFYASMTTLEIHDRRRKVLGFIYSVLHFVFILAALKVALGVEGTHFTPMLTFVCVSGGNSLLVSVAHWHIRGG